MIVKMKFLSITGPKHDFDRVTNTYLSKYETQLENALSELKTVDNLTPFAEMNPYKDALDKANEFATYLEGQSIEPASMDFDEKELLELVRYTYHDLNEIRQKEQALKAKLEVVMERLKIIRPFRSFQFDLHSVLQYKYVHFRFGRVSLDYYHKLEKYIYSDLNIVFLESGRDTEYVYGVYFVARKDAQRLDAIFKSMHFEKLYLPDTYDGHPYDACLQLEKDVDAINAEIAAIEPEIIEMLSKNGPKILAAKNKLEMLCTNFDLRRVAACVEEQSEQYYILCGWMSEKDVESFLEEVKDDPDVFVVVEDNKNKYFGEPPTKIENPKVFKPFELFTKMYGVPAHDEMDPTIFIALTYTFIFGIMFGDVGQGALLFIIGGLLYKLKGNNLAGIISMAGIFSMFFGFMFGSIFGFEDIIEARWLRPTEAMTTLPFIGMINSIFVITVAFGMGLILVAMILHIINAIKAHDLESGLLDPNGVAGLVFYGSLVGVIVLFMTGNALPATILLIVMFGLPLLLIFFKEPIFAKLQKKTYKPDSMGMFFVEGFFELFEILLSYFSNTLSFVRIGAFAVSHAAMMEVVLMLAGVESGNTNWVVIVLGNIIVVGMEGLVVGIQVLRLEYYEMFSRFYKGNGREFKPYISKEKNK